MGTKTTCTKNSRSTFNFQGSCHSCSLCYIDWFAHFYLFRFFELTDIKLKLTVEWSNEMINTFGDPSCGRSEEPEKHNILF